MWNWPKPSAPGKTQIVQGSNLQCAIVWRGLATQIVEPDACVTGFTLWNTRVLDDDVRHVCDTCFDKGKTESCLVKAPAMRASESVLVVSELLCTGVQANTERHTKERNARNVLMLGIQTTLLLTQFERVA